MEILSGLMNQNKSAFVSRLIAGVGLLHQESIYQAPFIKRLLHKLGLTDREVLVSLFSTTSLPLWWEPPTVHPPSSSFYTCSQMLFFLCYELTAKATVRCKLELYLEQVE